MPVNLLRDPNCQLAYLFREGTGTTVADRSNHGRTGTFNSVGHPAWSTERPAYNIRNAPTGSIEYITTGSLEILTSTADDVLAPFDGAWSCLAWIYPTIDVINGGNPRVLNRGSVQLTFEGAVPRGVTVFIEGATPLHRTSETILTFDTWQLLAVTGDGSTTAANYHIYMNGVESATYPTSQNGVTLTSNSGETLYVGNINAGGTRSLGGKLSHFLLFNRQLAVGEISNFYDYGPFSQFLNN